MAIAASRIEKVKLKEPPVVSGQSSGEVEVSFVPETMPEPLRRPDAVGHSSWPSDLAVVLIIVAVAIGGLSVTKAVVRLDEALEPVRWQKRLDQHNVQLSACLKAGGVPYFDDRHLFSSCQLPQGGPR